MSSAESILQSLGLVGLRLDYQTPIPPPIPTQTISIVSQLDDYLDNGGSVTDPKAMALSRGLYSSATIIPEPTISLREFISAFLKAIASVFQARGFAQIAEQLRMQHNIDRILGDIGRRIQKFENDSLRQSTAIRRFLAVMPGSASVVPEVPVINADNFSNSPPNSSSTALADSANNLPSTIVGSTKTWDELIKQLYIRLIKDSLLQVQSTGFDSGHGLIDTLKDILIERSGISSGSNPNPDYLAPKTSDTDSVNSDINSSLYQMIRGVPSQSLGGLEADWIRIVNAVMAESNTWANPNSNDFGNFNLTSIVDQLRVISDADMNVFTNKQGDVADWLAEYNDTSKLKTRFNEIANEVQSVFNALKGLNSLKFTLFPSADNKIYGPFWDNIAPPNTGYSVKGGSYLFNPDDNLFYQATRPIITVSNLRTVPTWTPKTYQPGELIRHGGTFYLCKQATTSAPGTILGFNKWEEAYAAEIYRTDRNYEALDLVYHSGKMYQAKQTTVGANTPVTNTSAWFEIGFGNPDYFSPNANYFFQFGAMCKAVKQAATNIGLQLTDDYVGNLNWETPSGGPTGDTPITLYEPGDIVHYNSNYYKAKRTIKHIGSFDVDHLYSEDEIFTIGSTSYITLPYVYNYGPPDFDPEQATQYSSGNVVRHNGAFWQRSATPTPSGFSPTSSYSSGSYTTIGNDFYQILVSITYKTTLNDSNFASSLNSYSVTNSATSSFTYNGVQYAMKTPVETYNSSELYAPGKCVYYSGKIYKRNSATYTGNQADFSPANSYYWTELTPSQYVADSSLVANLNSDPPDSSFFTSASEPAENTFWNSVSASAWVTADINSSTPHFAVFDGPLSDFFDFQAEQTANINATRAEFSVLANKLKNSLGSYVPAFSPFAGYTQGTFIFCNGHNYKVKSGINIVQTGAFSSTKGYSTGQVFTVDDATYITLPGVSNFKPTTYSTSQTYTTNQVIYHDGQLWKRTAEAEPSAPSPADQIAPGNIYFSAGSKFKIGNTYFQVASGIDLKYVGDLVLVDRGNTFDPTLTYNDRDVFTYNGVKYIANGSSTLATFSSGAVPYAAGKFVRGSDGNIWFSLKSTSQNPTSAGNTDWVQVSPLAYLSGSGKFNVLSMGSTSLVEQGIVATRGSINATASYSAGDTVASNGFVYKVLQSIGPVPTYSASTTYSVGDFVRTTDAQGNVTIWQLSVEFPANTTQAPADGSAYWSKTTLSNYVNKSGYFSSLNKASVLPLSPPTGSYPSGSTFSYNDKTYVVMNNLPTLPGYTSTATYNLGDYIQAGGVIWQLTKAFSGASESPRSGSIYWTQVSLDSFIANSGKFMPLSTLNGIVLDPTTNKPIDLSNSRRIGDVFTVDGTTNGFTYVANSNLIGLSAYSQNNTYSSGSYVTYGGDIWQRTSIAFPAGIPQAPSNTSVYWKKISLSSYLSASDLTLMALPSSVTITDKGTFNRASSYSVGDQFTYNGNIYVTTRATSGLQPYSADGTYNLGDYVTHNGSIWQRTSKPFIGGINQAPAQPSIYWVLVNQDSYVNGCGFFSQFIQAPSSLFKNVSTPSSQSSFWQVTNSKAWVESDLASGSPHYALYVTPAGSGQLPSAFFDFEPACSPASTPPSIIDVYVTSLTGFLTSISGFVHKSKTLIQASHDMLAQASTSDDACTAFKNFIINALERQRNMLLGSSGQDPSKLDEDPTIQEAYNVLQSWINALAVVKDSDPPSNRTGLAFQLWTVSQKMRDCVNGSTFTLASNLGDRLSELQEAINNFVSYLETDTRGVSDSVKALIQRLQDMFNGSALQPLGTYQAPAINALTNFKSELQTFKNLSPSNGNMNVQIVNHFFESRTLLESVAQSLAFRHSNDGTRMETVLTNSQADAIVDALGGVFENIHVIKDVAAPELYYYYALYYYGKAVASGSVVNGKTAAQWAAERDSALANFASAPIGPSGAPGYLIQLRNAYQSLKDKIQDASTEDSYTVCAINGNSLHFLNRGMTESYRNHFIDIRQTIVDLFNNIDRTITRADYSGTVYTGTTAMVNAVTTATTVDSLRSAFQNFITNVLTNNQAMLIGSQEVLGLPASGVTLKDTVDVLNSWKKALDNTRIWYTSYNADRGAFARNALSVVIKMLEYCNSDGTAVSSSSPLRNQQLSLLADELKNMQISVTTSAIIAESTVKLGDTEGVDRIYYSSSGPFVSTFTTELTLASGELSPSDSAYNRNTTSSRDGSGPLAPFDPFAAVRRPGNTRYFGGALVNPTNNTITIPNHGYNQPNPVTGVASHDPVIFIGNTDLGQLTRTYTTGENAGQIRIYYVIKVDDNTIKLAGSLNDAKLGNALNLEANSFGNYALRSDFVEYSSSTSVAAMTLLQIIAGLQNFFFKKRPVRRDVVDAVGFVGGTGTPQNFASWGWLDGRFQDVAYNLYIDTEDFEKHFSDVGKLRPTWLWSSADMQYIMEKAYYSAKSYFEGIVSNLQNFVSAFNNYHRVVESAITRWVTQAFATTAPCEDVLYKVFEADPTSPEEKRLAAKVLNLLLTILVAMLASNQSVRDAVMDLAAGRITLEQLTTNLRISQRLANTMIQRAAAMAADLLQRDRSNKNNSADFVASNPISAQSLYDLASFYQTNQAQMTKVRQIQRSEKDMSR